jgi:hypothetical protein
VNRRIDRAIWWVAGILVYAGFAVAVYHADSPTADAYRPVQAVAMESDGATTGQYPYQYRVGDRLCRGFSLMAADPGAATTVYYDPADVCTSLTYNPAVERLTDQGILLLVGASMAFCTWVVCQSFSAPVEEMTWQRS